MGFTTGEVCKKRALLKRSKSHSRFSDNLDYYIEQSSFLLLDCLFACLFLLA